MNTAVSCFAGIGGFDLALERNGYDVVAQIEIDKHAQNVLRKRFPLSTLYHDITEVKGEDLVRSGFVPAGGIITGGFPCQDLSVAGRRAGLGGERSGLFWHIHRLIEETETEWFILENVPGLLSSQRGRDMGIVITALVDLGYGVAWRVLDAQHFGVPQRRRRVFIVGHSSGDPRRAAEILAVSESVRGDSAAGNQAGQEVAGTVGGGAAVSSIDRVAERESDGDAGGRNVPSRHRHPSGRARAASRTAFGQTSFAGYSEGVTTLTATTYKRPEDNVVCENGTFGC